MNLHRPTSTSRHSRKPSRRLVNAAAIALSFIAATAATAQQGFGPGQAQPAQYPQQAQPQPGQYPQAESPHGQGQYPQGQGQYPQGQGQYPQGHGQAPQGQNPYAQPQTHQAGYGSATSPGGGVAGNPLQQLMQQELQDYGVAPQQQLQSQLHGPTPTSIPGGRVVTTDAVLQVLHGSQQNGALVLHVLGPGPTLPGALNAAPASAPGSFDDRTQQEFGQFLQQVSQGNKSRPLVLYCQNTHCWMSYNAALRAIQLGFTNVLWYRGGIEAWQQVEQMAMQMQQSGQLSGGQMQPGAQR